MNKNPISHYQRLWRITVNLQPGNQDCQDRKKCVPHTFYHLDFYGRAFIVENLAGAAAVHGFAAAARVFAAAARVVSAAANGFAAADTWCAGGDPGFAAADSCRAAAAREVSGRARVVAAAANRFSAAARRGSAAENPCAAAAHAGWFLENLVRMAASGSKDAAIPNRATAGGEAAGASLV
jgi:hypothetical protein